MKSSMFIFIFFLILITIDCSCDSVNCEKEKENFAEILQEAFGGREISEEMHSTFWRLVENCPNLKKMASQELEFLITQGKVTDEITKLFWEDALVSFRTEEVYISKRRKELEDEIFDDELKARNYNYMLKIAQREEIDFNGIPQVADDEVIQTILSNLVSRFEERDKSVGILYDEHAFNQ